MGIVFESTQIPTVLKQRNGPETTGYARFIARLVEPSDNAFGREHPASVSTLRRSRLEPDGSLKTRAPFNVIGRPPEGVVPKAVIESLPDDGLLAVQWEFSPR